MVSERGDDDKYVVYEVDQQKSQLNMKLAMKLWMSVFVDWVNVLSADRSGEMAEFTGCPQRLRFREMFWFHNNLSLWATAIAVSQG